MIPKKIHYVWFGDKDFGEIEKKCMETWHKVLPEYEIVRWGNDCIDKFDNRYFREAIAAKQYAFASDYVRLYALYHEGGIYMDTDEEVIKPLDEFLEHDYFMGCQKCGSARGLNPALVGAVPHNGVVKDLLAVYDDLAFVNPDGSFNLKPNPAYFADVLTEKYGLKETFVKSGRIEFYPNSFVYDYDHFGTDNKDAYAVHRYSASWRPDWKVLNKLTLRWGGASYILRKYKKRREAKGKVSSGIRGCRTMLPGHWLRGLSRSSKNRCGRTGRKPLRRCGTEIGAGERGKPAAEVRAEICAGVWGENWCGVGAEAGVC